MRAGMGVNVLHHVNLSVEQEIVVIPRQRRRKTTTMRPSRTIPREVRSVAARHSTPRRAHAARHRPGAPVLGTFLICRSTTLAHRRVHRKRLDGSTSTSGTYVPALSIAASIGRQPSAGSADAGDARALMSRPKLAAVRRPSLASPLIPRSCSRSRRPQRPGEHRRVAGRQTHLAIRSPTAFTC